jgi:hypothetical protein
MIHVLRETHDTPESVAHSLELAGGINRFREPNYRAVWGWNRLAWIGGKFEERQEPKYPAVNRWHIEKWLPPETYGSPRAWWAQTVEIEGGRSVPALGPYPARGDYEHCFTLEGPRGEFVQLTATIAQHIARAIEWSRRHPRSAGKRALRSRTAPGARLRCLGVRLARRRRSGISSPAIRYCCRLDLAILVSPSRTEVVKQR